MIMSIRIILNTYVIESDNKNFTKDTDDNDLLNDYVDNDNDNTGNVDNNNAYAKSDNIDTDHF